MIRTNTYNDKNILLRYYFQKILPESLYAYFNGIFFERIVNRNMLLCFKEEFRQNRTVLHLNVSNPVTFTDKINFLKLNELTPLKTLLTDKITAKDYIKSKIPELKQAKIFQTASCYEDLDFSTCPESFIIKTNHACKTGILVENKNSIKNETYKKYYKKVLKINYAYWGTFELQYKNIIPKIFIEENLFADLQVKQINEYEVWCLNGNPIFIQYMKNTQEEDPAITFLNNKFEPNKFSINTPFFEKIDVKTSNKDKILNYAKILSCDFKFCRCDFFEVENELFFGELTFTPHSCNIRFFPENYDLILGNMLKI